MMAKVKLTKSVVNAAQPRSADYELRDIVVPGFLCKVTPQGSKVFMVQYRTDSGLRRKPAIGLFGALTVEEARGLARLVDESAAWPRSKAPTRLLPGMHR
jgi:Arm DNA-binding domain